VVKQGNPRGVRSLADLTSVGIVSLCGAEVPCGIYADLALQRANVLVPADRVTRAQNANAAFTAVAEGDADAGIVYVTDIKGERVSAVSIPEEHNAVVTYPIATMKATTNAAAAQAFVAFVLGDRGRAVLEQAGFGTP